LPIDYEAQKTKTFAIVELQSADKAKTVVSKLNKFKLKVPKFGGAAAAPAAASSATPTSTPTKASNQLSVWRVVDVESLNDKSPNNASRKDLMVKEVCLSHLLSPPPSIFHAYGYLVLDE